MNLIDDIRRFIYDYYINGIIHDTPYNPVDTVTYAILLGMSIFGILKLLEKANIKVNDQFIYSVIPYIITGSVLRVMEDSGLFPVPWEYLFITPILYFVIFAITISSLAISIKLERMALIRDYRAVFAPFGIIISLISAGILIGSGDFRQPQWAFIIFLISISMIFLIYFISSRFNFRLLTDRLNLTLLWAHLFDASSTFIGMDVLNYIEKHVVPTFMIDLTGTAAVMYPLKLGIFIPVLYILDNHLGDDDRLRNLMKLAILVLGLSPAVRNTLRILMGV